MTSPLENLSGPGKSLQKEPPDAKEIAGLKRSGLARVMDADLVEACKAVAAALDKLPPPT